MCVSKKKVCENAKYMLRESENAIIVHRQRERERECKCLSEKERVVSELKCDKYEAGIG